MRYSRRNEARRGQGGAVRASLAASLTARGASLTARGASLRARGTALTARGTALAALLVMATASAEAKPPAREAPASQRLPTVEQIVERVEKARAGQETLQAEFSQRKRISLFRDEVRSTGKIAFRRPAKLRWEYVAPDPAVVIIDGTRVTTKTPGARPETHDLAKLPALKSLLLPILAALGSAPLREAARDFEMSVVGPSTLRLVPRGEAARHMTLCDLRFDGAWQVQGVRLVEKNGDETDVTFRNVKRNARIDEGAFRP